MAKVILHVEDHEENIKAIKDIFQSDYNARQLTNQLNGKEYFNMINNKNEWSLHANIKDQDIILISTDTLENAEELFKLHKNELKICVFDLHFPDSIDEHGNKIWPGNNETHAYQQGAYLARQFKDKLEGQLDIVFYTANTGSQKEPLLQEGLGPLIIKGQDGDRNEIDTLVFKKIARTGIESFLYQEYEDMLPIFREMNFDMDGEEVSGEKLFHKMLDVGKTIYQESEEEGFKKLKSMRNEICEVFYKSFFKVIIMWL